MKLYELAVQYREDVARLQDIDIPPEVVLDTIDSMQGDISEKIKAVVIVAMEIEAEGKVRAEHAKRMADSAKSMLQRAEGLRSYAQIAIQNCGLALPLKYPEFSVALQANPATCEVTDVALLPPDMKATTITFEAVGYTPSLKEALAQYAKGGVAGISIDTTPDKKAVLDALKLVAKANSTKDADAPRDVLPGARINPTAYRLVVK